MTPAEAEKIVNEYGRAIKISPGPYGIAQSLDDLPCNPGRIKQALFILGEESVKRGTLTKQVGDSLIAAYSLLGSQFREDFEKINLRYKETMDGLKEGKMIENPVISVIDDNLVKAEIEFNNFLADCQNRYGTKFVQ